MQVALKTMLSMQDRMNTRVHTDWINQQFEWYRAVWIECGELIDHVGYKWWKKQEADMDQVRLEVVDIWHFGMSALFDATTDLDALARRIEVDLYHAEPETSDVRLATEALALDSLHTKSFSVPCLLSLCWLVASALRISIATMSVKTCSIFFDKITAIKRGLTSRSGRDVRIMSI